LRSMALSFRADIPHSVCPRDFVSFILANMRWTVNYFSWSEGLLPQPSLYSEIRIWRTAILC
jgi:hypothetical protein